MRILHAISSVNPTGGGPIEGLKQLDESIPPAATVSKWLRLMLQAHPFLQFPLPVYPLGPPLGPYRYSSYFAPWLRDNVANYDIVIINGIWQYNSFGAWRVLRKS